MTDLERLQVAKDLYHQAQQAYTWARDASNNSLLLLRLKRIADQRHSELTSIKSYLIEKP